jgi:hypothetical protein
MTSLRSDNVIPLLAALSGRTINRSINWQLQLLRAISPVTNQRKHSSSSSFGDGVAAQVMFPKGVSTNPVDDLA